MIRLGEWTWNLAPRQGVVETRLGVDGNDLLSADVSPAKMRELGHAFIVAADAADGQMPAPPRPTPESVSVAVREGPAPTSAVPPPSGSLHEGVKNWGRLPDLLAWTVRGVIYYAVFHLSGLCR